MTVEERLHSLERKLAVQRKILLLGACAILATGTLASIGPFVPPDPEAFKVRTFNEANQQTNRFQISGNENVAKVGFVNSDVGIGNAVPAQKLDVTGNIKSSGFVELQNQTSDPAAGGTDTQRIYTAADNVKFRLSTGTIRQLATLDGAEALTNKTVLSTDGNTIDATKLQTRNISANAPSDGQVLKWNASSSVWEPGTGGGGGVPAGTWELVAEVTAASATTFLEVTGLNGNTDKEYLIRTSIVTTGTGGATKNFLLRFNGDSGATNHFYTVLFNTGTSSLSIGQSQTSGINLATISVDGEHVMNNGWIRAASGLTHREYNGTSNISATSFRYITGEWTNVSTNVTSMRVEVAQGTPNIGPGSTLKIWRQKP